MQRYFSKLIVALLFYSAVNSLHAQCPANVQYQGNNNSQAVSISFNNASGTSIGGCNCNLAGNSGNLNCPASCPFTIPGTGYTSVTLSWAGNTCIYNSSGALTGTLPIELTYFSATADENNILLEWETATETNNDYFTIEKTQDLQTFTLVEKMQGAGNSTSVKRYSTKDNSPYSGISYYRLKQTDFNGKYSYSGFQPVTINGAISNDLNVYPNPGTNTNINYSINSEEGKEILVVVYDVTGREAYSKVIITQQAGENVFALDPSGSLSPGVYMITATSQETIHNKKLIVQ